VINRHSYRYSAVDQRGAVHNVRWSS